MHLTNGTVSRSNTTLRDGDGGAAGRTAGREEAKGL